MKKQTVSLITLAMIGTAFCAAAQPGGGANSDMKTKILEKFDTDGDGQISESERAVLRETMQEKGGRKRGSRMNGKSGKMNQERSTKMQDKFDTDGDGELSEAERTAMRAKMQENGGRKQSGIKRRGANPEQRAEILAKFDTDGDGELSDAERAALKAYAQTKKAERNTTTP